jgi:hypothetical protein
VTSLRIFRFGVRGLPSTFLVPLLPLGRTEAPFPLAPIAVCTNSFLGDLLERLDSFSCCWAFFWACRFARCLFAASRILAFEFAAARNAALAASFRIFSNAARSSGTIRCNLSFPEASSNRVDTDDITERARPDAISAVRSGEDFRGAKLERLRCDGERATLSNHRCGEEIGIARGSLFAAGFGICHDPNPAASNMKNACTQKSSVFVLLEPASAHFLAAASLFL